MAFGVVGVTGNGYAGDLRRLAAERGAEIGGDIAMLVPPLTRMGIAAAYAPQSKYKVFWTLILAAPDEKRN